MEKKALRQQILQCLSYLKDHPNEKKRRQAAIYQKLFAHPKWQSASCIGMIRSTDLELDTKPIMQQAFLEGKKVVVPKSLANHQMIFYQVTENTDYYVTKFGVEEPHSSHEVTAEQIDLLIVPGVVFRHDGYRIGYGGGYFDCYLANYHHDTLSLVFEEQLNDDWQVDDYDVAVSELIIG